MNSHSRDLVKDASDDVEPEYEYTDRAQLHSQSSVVRDIGVPPTVVEDALSHVELRNEYATTAELHSPPDPLGALPRLDRYFDRASEDDQTLYDYQARGRRHAQPIARMGVHDTPYFWLDGPEQIGPEFEDAFRAHPHTRSYGMGNSLALLNSFSDLTEDVEEFFEVPGRTPLHIRPSVHRESYDPPQEPGDAHEDMELHGEYTARAPLRTHPAARQHGRERHRSIVRPTLASSHEENRIPARDRKRRWGRADASSDARAEIVEYNILEMRKYNLALKIAEAVKRGERGSWTDQGEDTRISNGAVEIARIDRKMASIRCKKRLRKGRLDV